MQHRLFALFVFFVCVKYTLRYTPVPSWALLSVIGRHNHVENVAVHYCRISLLSVRMYSRQICVRCSRPCVPSPCPTLADVTKVCKLICGFFFFFFDAVCYVASRLSASGDYKGIATDWCLRWLFRFVFSVSVFWFVSPRNVPRIVLVVPFELNCISKI